MLRRLAGAVRCAAVTALLVGGASAQASLIGSEVSCAIVPTPLWMCDAPTATVSGLAANTAYFFAVSAYNGLESPCSAELSTGPLLNSQTGRCAKSAAKRWAQPRASRRQWPM